MTSRVCILPLLLSSLALAARADQPRLLFDRSDIPALRQRIAEPELAPVWAKILAEAEAYCDPASPRYADPENPYPLPEKRDRVGQRRHDATLVHMIGRKLTQRMEAIGFAYHITGRKALGRHGAALLLATVRRYPVSNPIVAKGFAGGRGDIMRGLAIGYDLLADCLDPQQQRLVGDACAGYLDLAVKEFNNPKLWWYKVHNYNGVNGGAAGCLALVLSDQFPQRSGAWVAECVKTVDRWLDVGFDRQGAYLEGVTYSGYGLSNTVLFADALQRAGRGDLFDHPTFRTLPQFYALSLLPGEGVYDARNDSSYSGLGVSVLKLADACNNGLYRWLWDVSGSDSTILRILWDNHVRPVAPTAASIPKAAHFEGRGLAIWRTGWTKSDLMFSIEAGLYYPVTHNQADKGHFTLYGLGYRWSTDCGYANEHEPRGRGQTLGHSCVLIDGQGQALSGAGWGTNGTIATYANTDRYGYALAECTEAYNRNNAGKPGAGVKHARRHAFFLYPHKDAPAYAVVMDDLCKDDRPHEFTWQMMLSDRTRATLTDGRVLLQPFQASGHAYVDTPATEGEEGKRRSTRSGHCRLAFEVTEAGQYVVWARVRAAAENPSSADSFHVGIDDGQTVAWHMPPRRDWTWARVSSGTGHAPVGFPLTAGPHTLVLKTREPGAQVDCLLLTRDQQTAPALFPDRSNPLFLEAEAGRLAAPMRSVSVQVPEPRLVLRIHADSKPALSTDVFRPDDYRRPAAFPRLRATVRAVNPRFIAVLLPLPGATAEPEVRFESRQDQQITTIRWPTHTDTIVWNDSDGSAKLADPR